MTEQTRCAACVDCGHYNHAALHDCLTCGKRCLKVGRAKECNRPIRQKADGECRVCSLGRMAADHQRKADHPQNHEYDPPWEHAEAFRDATEAMDGQSRAPVWVMIELGHRATPPVEEVAR